MPLRDSLFMKYVVLSLPLAVLSFAFCASPARAADSPSSIIIQRVTPQGDAIVIERIEDIEPEAGASDADPTQSAIFKVLQGGSVAGRSLKHPQALQDFYSERGYKGYWTQGSKLKRDAPSLIKILEDSWTHGLNPFSYHLKTLRVLREDDSEDARAQMDVLLSDAYVRYGQDLTGIRVNPAAFGSDRRYWQRSMEPSALLDLLSRDIGSVVDSFTPRGETYKRLRKELMSLVEQRPEAYEAVLPIRIEGLLRPYQEHKAVPDLRVRFGLSGSAGNYVYDDQVASAVMRFQRDHNLAADGVIGPSTLRAINASRMEKIKQIIANLERLRWVEEKKPDTFVVVNIPSAMLWAVDDGRLQFEMPVIVGREKRATNIFVTEITGVRFNPTWTVPPTIKKEDIVPKLIEDPMYLSNKGMELLEGSGADAVTLDPASIDWANITEDELKSLRMVQVSGAHNPLGNIRVLMPNGYNIYLHDTNEPDYFDRPGRAASSGCIRLKDPRRMAQFILQHKDGWSEDLYYKAFESKKMKDVFVTQTIPIYIVYYTVWIGDNGQLVYSNDLYGYDNELIKMLSKIDGFFIPIDNNDI